MFQLLVETKDVLEGVFECIEFRDHKGVRLYQVRNGCSTHKLALILQANVEKRFNIISSVVVED